MSGTKSKGHSSSPVAPWWDGRLWPILLLLVVAALAHGPCLKSQFYLDDSIAILFNDQVRDGRVWGSGVLTWTHFGYWLQTGFGGEPNPVVFHAVNWLLHAGNALLLWALARALLGIEKRGVALVAALLFAAHPLGSEIPNYARTQDLAWVTLFSLGAAWAARVAATGGNRWSWVALPVCILGATFSKGPGIVHAFIAVVPVLLLSAEGFVQRALTRRWPWLVVGGIVLLGILLVSGWWWRIAVVTGRWAEPTFAGHGLTVCRSFWEFAWRAVVPVASSADHHVAETMVPPGTSWYAVPDRVALWSAAGLLVYLLVTAWLSRRKSTRWFGLGLWIFGLTMAMRVFYIVDEYMPEYRIYPGLPWFCLSAAIVLGWVGRHLPAIARVGLVTGIVAVFCWMSFQRSLLWHDIDKLMADVLDRYPGQLRSVWVMQSTDARAGRWQKVLERQRTLFPKVDKTLMEQNGALAPKRQLPTGRHALALIGSYGCQARALAATGQGRQAVLLLAQLEAALHRVQPPPQKVHWFTLSHARGLVFEQLGMFDAAIRELDLEDGVTGERLVDLERVKAKQAALNHSR
jgi:hypothetical protein